MLTRSDINHFFYGILTSRTYDKLSISMRSRLIFLNVILFISIIFLFALGWKAMLPIEPNRLLWKMDFIIGGIIILLFLYTQFIKNITISSYAFIIIAIFLFLGLTLSGGSSGSGILWTLVFPLFSFFLLGRLKGIIFSLFFGIVITYSVLFSGFSRFAYDIEFVIRTLAIYVFILVFALSYEVVRRYTQNKLEETNRKSEKYSYELLMEKAQTDIIMTNVGEGIFLLDSQLRFGSTYSKFLEELLGNKYLNNSSFLDSLKNKISDKLLSATGDYLKMFFEENINEELLKEINPIDTVEITLDSGDGKLITKHLNFKFTRISQKHETKILGTVNDFTEEAELSVRLEEEEKKNIRQMQNLFQIIHVTPEMMDEFLNDTDSELEIINDVLKSKEKNYSIIVDKIYQSIHAIKGNAVLLGLEAFGNEIHNVEEKLKSLKEKDASWDDLLELTIIISNVKTTLNEIRELIDKILAIRTRIKHSFAESGTIFLSALDKLVKKTCEETGKKAALKASEFQSAYVPAKYRKIVKDILIQLIRNSITHGIETPDGRKAAGKAEQGTIYLKSSNHNEYFTINYKDDGRGFNLDGIKNKARDYKAFQNINVDSMPSGKLLGLLFYPGFSTSDNVDLSSGRGMGMNVIKSSVIGNGGKLQIRHKHGKGCEFIISLPNN